MAWHIITQGDDQNSNYKEFLLDSEEDIEAPPDNLSYAPSSLAHTPGFAQVWEANSAGEWIELSAQAVRSFTWGVLAGV